MDSFFSRGFKASKCKTLLKLTIPRIKLLKNRREIQIKQMRREIAKLLETGQEATARIRVEHVIREEKMIGAQDIVELFCELITVRLPIIEAQRDCPLDLKEAIASICFAAPRCADLTELQQLVELLSIQVPTPDVKLRLLKGIAEEHGLDWDPNASESELLKTHEDLLNGPTQFVNGLKVPFPQHGLANATTLEPSARTCSGLKVPVPQHDLVNATTLEPSVVKHSEYLLNGAPQSVNGFEVHSPQYDLANATTLEPHSDSDEGFDIIDFREVPRQPLQSNKGTVSTPETLRLPASSPPDTDHENLPHSESVMKEEASIVSSIRAEDKQFVPFVRPPITRTATDDVDLRDVLAAVQEAAKTAECAICSQSCTSSYHGVHEEKGQRSLELLHFRLDNPKLDMDGKAEIEGYPHVRHHQHQRLASMDEDMHISYPNLFTSQGSY